jgi:hypothetical protein
MVAIVEWQTRDKHRPRHYPFMAAIVEWQTRDKHRPRHYPFMVAAIVETPPCGECRHPHYPVMASVDPLCDERRHLLCRAIVEHLSGEHRHRHYPLELLGSRHDRHHRRHYRRLVLEPPGKLGNRIQTGQEQEATVTFYRVNIWQ